MGHELKWGKLLKEQSLSGLSAEAWCRREGIKKHQYYYWRSRLKKPAGDEGRFVELSSNEPLELLVGNKLRIRVPLNFEKSSLKRLLEVLDAES